MQAQRFQKQSHWTLKNVPHTFTAGYSDCSIFGDMYATNDHHKLPLVQIEITNNGYSMLGPSDGLPTRVAILGRRRTGTEP